MSPLGRKRWRNQACRNRNAHSQVAALRAIAMSCEGIVIP
jgi:hypothetical protein